MDLLATADLLADLPVGEGAAIAAATLWAAGSLLFTSASRRATHWGVNQFRLFTATPVLLAIWAIGGLAGEFESLPPARQTLLLVISGVVGLVIGDVAIFRAWTILGARRVALLSSLAPVMVAAMAVPLLGETIGLIGIIGMTVTVAGILWVVVDREQAGEPIRGSVKTGIVMSVIAALGQAAGGVLAKGGLGLAALDSPLGAFVAAGDAPVASVSPLLAVVIRMTISAVAFAAYTIPSRSFHEFKAVFADRTTLVRAATATLLGTVLGVWLSIIAFARTEAGIAQTLLSLTPVLVLPMALIATDDRPPARAWIGAIIAFAGVALLAFRHQFG